MPKPVGRAIGSSIVALLGVLMGVVWLKIGGWWAVATTGLVFYALGFMAILLLDYLSFESRRLAEIRIDEALKFFTEKIFYDHYHGEHLVLLHQDFKEKVKHQAEPVSETPYEEQASTTG